MLCGGDRNSENFYILSNTTNKLAPQVRFELTTKWLTATYSTIELLRNRISKFICLIEGIILKTNQNVNSIYMIFITCSLTRSPVSVIISRFL